MSFDEQPDAPLHGECAHEIHRLQAELNTMTMQYEEERDLLAAARVEVEQLKVAAKLHTCKLEIGAYKLRAERAEAELLDLRYAISGDSSSTEDSYVIVRKMLARVAALEAALGELEGEITKAANERKGGMQHNGPRSPFSQLPPSATNWLTRLIHTALAANGGA